ncbi:rhodanese-like domain-containing protein [Shewanella chilikensis]|uniref:rhodanese-like domain-containing protein n=1 Tax=Shewanella chilikensis TaxID=558541 RepID=UPI001F3AB3DC|nr:rhodanese-like domain-containing protein [Shewanella chilikensis]MCE9788657.1 sulfurtransferase [Shewanella chilikensis]
MTNSLDFMVLVEQARELVRELSIEEYQHDDRWQLIDVREDHEWLKDRLPLAKHLSRGILERDIGKRFPDKSVALLLYSASGQRAILAALSLQRLGYRNVASLDGGYRAWCAHELPLVQD